MNAIRRQKDGRQLRNDKQTNKHSLTSGNHQLKWLTHDRSQLTISTPFHADKVHQGTLLALTLQQDKNNNSTMHTNVILKLKMNYSVIMLT